MTTIICIEELKMNGFFAEVCEGEKGLFLNMRKGDTGGICLSEREMSNLQLLLERASKWKKKK